MVESPPKSMRITQWVPVSIAILIIFYLAFTQTERKQVFASKPLKKAERTVSIRKDQVRDVEYIGTFRSYSRQYKFIRYKDNFLTFNTPPADVQILSALSEADSRKVRITHIGDSHIQCDIMTGVIREKLQAAFGYAGRGFIFPYRVAGSNNPEDYSVSSTGSWIYSRNTHAVAILPTGASGYSVQTSNPQAGITFNFRNPTNKALGNEVKVWCQTGESDFEPRLVLDDTVIVAPQALEKGKSYYTFKLPTAVTQQLRLKIAATKSTQRTFTLHGLTLENADSTGIVYSSMGVNGARISAYLNAPLLKTQLQAMQPDMVVLDIGVNDYYARPCLPVYVADSLQELIDQVSNAVPNATILLTSQQPTAYKRKTVPATLAFAQTVKDLNKQNFKVGLYDFFTVTNSRQAVEYWEGYKMMQKDGIHLTHTGYTHKAELFTNALLGAYQQYLLKGKTCTPTTEPLVLNTIVGDDMDIAPSEANGLTNVADSAAQAANSEEESGLPDNGETPEAKPERKLTKKELKQKKLEEKRERQKEERALALKKQKKAEKRAALTGSIVPYVIQKGDNLTAIANKFHVSITSLQELNGMGKSVSITAGKTLKIPSR